MVVAFGVGPCEMLDKQLTMAQVAEKISQNFGEDLFVIWSDDTADKLIIRCRVVRDPKSLDEDADAEEDQILKRIEAPHVRVYFFAWYSRYY